MPAFAPASAPRRAPLYGTEPARAAGTAAGTVAGTAMGLTTLDASREASALLPEGLRRQALVRAGIALARPAHAALGAAVKAGVRLAPPLAYVAYAPGKVADAAAALWSMAADGTGLADEATLLRRAPHAPYPAACDPRWPEPSCPDPLAYVRAAQLAPFVYAGLAVVLGAAVGGAAAAGAWQWGALHLAQTPDAWLAAIDNRFGREAMTAVVRLARRARNEQLADAAARVRGEEEAGRAPAAAAAAPDARAPSPSDPEARTTARRPKPPAAAGSDTASLASDGAEEDDAFFDALDVQPTERTPLL